MGPVPRMSPLKRGANVPDTEFPDRLTTHQLNMLVRELIYLRGVGVDDR